VATQAARLLVNHLFDATPIERLLATVVVGNKASVKVLENAGLTHEGVERRKVFLHGIYQDTHQLSIIRCDWVSEETYRKNHEF
jgi:[ribosomal protein S5]-alanine N-acetyltransferase